MNVVCPVSTVPFHHPLNFPNFNCQAKTIIERHTKMGERLVTFEELVEMTRRSPRRTVDMIAGELAFTQLGEIELSKYQEFGMRGIS